MPLIMFVSSSFNTYVNLPKKKEDGKSENSREDNGERRPLDLAKPKSLIKPIESGKIKETT
jgi:hypothetical protein